jgi:hypothetical protein
MKVLETDSDVHDYVKEVRENFLTCRYAPFTAEGALVGYLKAGSPARFLNNIAVTVPCQMKVGWNNPPRHHTWSDHPRCVPDGKDYLPTVRCHHLILEVRLGRQ